MKIAQKRIRRYIRGRISSNMWHSLKDLKGGRNWETIVGYSVEDLIQHLEQLFVEGMTWENIGEWHIDHIIPISAFSYASTDCVDFKVCWGLSNLQPLWAKENMSKGAKLDWVRNL